MLIDETPCHVPVRSSVRPRRLSCAARWSAILSAAARHSASPPAILESSTSAQSVYLRPQTLKQALSRGSGPSGLRRRRSSFA